jgi:hypothetical protein
MCPVAVWFDSPIIKKSTTFDNSLSLISAIVVSMPVIGKP